jgi:hypothetical protein
MLGLSVSVKRSSISTNSNNLTQFLTNTLLAEGDAGVDFA